MATKAEQDAAAAAEAEAATKKGEKVVKYVGTADVREIDSNAWKSIGVEDQNKVVWDKSNKFTVPASDLSKQALAWLDDNEESLVVTDAE